MGHKHKKKSKSKSRQRPRLPSVINLPQPNCPPGMEYLIATDAIIVNQHMDETEIMPGFQMNNRYDILDRNGIRMYLAGETTDFLSRQCLGGDRNFNIIILDNSGVPVLTIQRAYVICKGSVVTVRSPDNAIIFGEIGQTGCCSVDFSIRDGTGTDHLTIQGPCNCCILCKPHFPVNDLRGKQIGDIHRHWKGLIAEAFTNADTFGVSFPLDLDPMLKCLLLAGVFLIDFMLFEDNDTSVIDDILDVDIE